MASSISVPVPPELQKERRKQYYEAVGHALSTWMQVEGWLVGMFVAIYDAKHLIPLRHTFACVQSAEVKLKTISRALLSPQGLSPEDEEQFQSDWKKIRKKLSKHNLFRNKLAHGIVTGRGTREGLFIYLDPFPWENDIPIIDAAKRALSKGEKPEFEVPPPSAISLEEIIEFKKCLEGMYGEVSKFSHRVSARRLSDER